MFIIQHFIHIFYYVEIVAKQWQYYNQFYTHSNMATSDKFSEVLKGVISSEHYKKQSEYGHTF